MKHYQYSYKKYNFEKYLLDKYKLKFNCLENFEDIHHILNDECFNNYIDYFNEPIKLFGINDRDSIFVKYFYELWDTDYTLNYLYLQFIYDNIKPLFPLEDYIVIQKTPNIRFHLNGFSNIGRLPTDNTYDCIGLHKDSDFNHNTDSLNIIIPITPMFHSNSIHYEPTINSNLNITDYKTINLFFRDVFVMGDLVNRLHYNKINTTGKSRVSLDIRVIPYSKYVESNKESVFGKKFKLGGYYMKI